MSCGQCSTSISPCTLIGIDPYDFNKLNDRNYHGGYSVECGQCALKSLLSSTALQSLLQDIVREELKKIIKEEVHDPNGAFSPSGPEQT